MKKLLITSLSVLLAPTFLAAQANRVEPIRSSKPQPVAQPTVRTDLSAETLAVLRDIRRRTPDREAQIEAALNLRSEVEAKNLLETILADVEAEAAARNRLSLEEVNRTEVDREEYVDYMTRRLRGEVALEDAPASFRSRVRYRDPDTGDVIVRRYEPRYYDDNRRVITYRSRREIPPVLLASDRLARVQVAAVADSPFADELVVVDDMPEAYIQPEAYAVTYAVDPNSQITRDDILFVQGSTEFADAYSHDIVVDLATAMNDPSLANEAFIVEGHASAEGDYTTNLTLSQQRAERIVRDMVRFGVSSSRLVPVGYGENEAKYPASAPENLRATDRRVAVFRLR
ncbi:MAG: OmpA family protein [Verrucomicrobiales bacterium]